MIAQKIDWIEQGAQRQRQAAERLQHMVDQALRSFEVQDYRRCREAALKATRPHLAEG